MMRIVIVCLLISLVKSETCKLNSNELDSLRNLLLSSMDFFDADDKNENAAIFLGMAKSGKSTLINYLIGTELQLKKFKITKADESSGGPVIGTTAMSETIIPSKWKSEKLSNLTIWDTPGFVDNRGIVQEISNSFNIFNLMKSFKNLKIVLVCDFSNVDNDNPEEFLHLLDAVENLLGSKFAKIFPTITMILTKVPNDVDGTIIDQSLITEKLEVDYVNKHELSMSENVRNFLNYLVHHPDRIALFKKVKKQGIISASDVDVNIFQALKSSQSISNDILQELQPSMSDISKICLAKTQRELLLNPLYEHVDLVNKEITKLIDKKATDNSAELSNIQDILQKAVNNRNNIVQQWKLIETINSDVREMIRTFDIVKTIKLVEFIDSLWQSQEKTNANLIGNLQLKSLLEHVNRVMFARNLTALNKEIALKTDEIEKTKVKLNKQLKEKEQEYQTHLSRSQPESVENDLSEEPEGKLNKKLEEKIQEHQTHLSRSQPESLEKDVFEKIKAKLKKESEEKIQEHQTYVSPSQSKSFKPHIVILIAVVVGVLALCFYFTHK